MKDLSELLSKFKLIPDPKREKDLIIKVIFDIVGITLESESLIYTNSILKINCHPVIKSKIYLNKEQIILKLNEELKKYDKKCVSIV